VPHKAAHRRSAVILTALDVETKAVLRHLNPQGEKTIGGTVFYRGKFEDWDIAVAETGAGNTSAAAIAERAIANFRPSVALFVGVAGGVKDVVIGDVVVADKMYGYESGKEDETGFKPRPEVKNAAHDIEQRGRALPKSDDWRKRLNGDLDHRSPSVFVGPIAGGEKVVASNSAPTAEFLRKFYSDALAVEMEGRGFLEAVNINALVMGGVVRGISDLLSGKAEADARGLQALAADAASAAVFEILHALPPPAQSRERKPVEKPPPKPTKTRSPGPRPKRASALDVVSGAALAPAAFMETPSTFSKAVYFSKGEVLAKIGVPNVDEILFSYFDTPDAYLRIIPMSPLPQPLSLATLREVAVLVPIPMLKKRPGNLVAVNEYGVIGYDPAHSSRGGPAPLNWATQLFRNGELWAVSNTMIVRKHNGRPEWLPLPILPAFVFEELYYDNLHSSVAFAREHLSLKPPFQIELGLLDTRGMHIGINTDDIRGPVQAKQAVLRVTLPDAERENINSALLEFFNDVHDLSGYRRPLGLYGFPPGPPRP
jgi:nucleoside phosphorylase